MVDDDFLRLDLRWRRLQKPRICPRCNGSHAGIFDLAFDKPQPWSGTGRPIANSEVERWEHFLSEDLCVANGEDFFVRCVLPIPIIGSGGETFAYGVWSSLSRENFGRYVDTFESGAQDELGPWFGWFSNRLKGYPETLFLRCQVHPRSGGRRPWIEIEPGEHPLAIEQREGMTLDRLLEIYALNGHDFATLLRDRS